MTYVLPTIIAVLRENAGLNQSQLAKNLGVSASAVHQVENAEHAVQELVFVRYTAAMGYPSEFAALVQGVELLRAKTAPTQSATKAGVKTRSALQKRSATKSSKKTRKRKAR